MSPYDVLSNQCFIQLTKFIIFGVIYYLSPFKPFDKESMVVITCIIKYQVVSANIIETLFKDNNPLNKVWMGFENTEISFDL